MNTLQETLDKLYLAVKKGKFIDLRSGLFTKEVLFFFYKKDVFPRNFWNKYNAMNDYRFLVSMLEHKGEFATADKKRVQGLIFYHIIPFLKMTASSQTRSFTFSNGRLTLAK